MSSPFLNPGRIVVASGTLIGGTVGLATTAFGVPSSLDCGPGATAISASVCEADFTTVGEATWTPPANVSTVEALIVGGGGSGGAIYGVGYGGGGGEVKVVTLDNTGAVTVTVGGKNNPSSTVQGSTTNTATEGDFGSDGGTSGSGHLGAPSSPNAHGGGGAGGDSNGNVGGVGVVVSSLTSTLFSDDTDCFGGGGGSITYDYNGNLPVGQQYNWYQGGASCGGGYADETNDVISLYDAIANSGGGGGANGATGDALAGASGRVIIRFTFDDVTTTTTETVLAQTGSNTKPLAELGMFLMVLGSVGYLAGRRRTKA